MSTDSFQLSASVERTSSSVAAASDPAATIRCSPIDADDFRSRGEAASDFSNLARTVSSASPSRCPEYQAVDPATGPVAGGRIDVWRSVPTVNDVALTGEDHGVLWPRGRTHGWLPAGRAATLQEQAHGALTPAQVVEAVPSDCWTIWRRSSGCR
jgi:hypothetical protein